jgi:3-oxoacyl-[acyl-carrier-protein] synthase I
VIADDAVVVTAIGMTTPVGFTAAQSCAAVRAGIAAIAELDFVIETDDLDRVPAIGCAVRGVTDGYLGLGRWTRLATAALKDLVTNARLSETELAAAGLYLALPPVARDGVDARLPQLLGPRIAQWMRAADVANRTRTYPLGHAAGAVALSEAATHVAQGGVPRAIVCGVDSLVEAATLAYYASKRRLKTDDRVDGFVPGEAAACVLVERASQARARGVSALAAIEAASIGTEPTTIWSDDPSDATGLSDAIRGTLDQLPTRGADTRVIVCDLNGETYRAKEFGAVAARVLSAIPAKWAVWHPADSIGDTGAASFAVSTCVGVRGLAKGYAKGDRVLVFGSSDDGLRGSVSLRRIPVEA